jgi:hypothetical protein
MELQSHLPLAMTAMTNHDNATRQTPGRVITEKLDTAVYDFLPFCLYRTKKRATPILWERTLTMINKYRSTGMRETGCSGSEVYPSARVARFSSE